MLVNTPKLEVTPFQNPAYGLMYTYSCKGTIHCLLDHILTDLHLIFDRITFCKMTKGRKCLYTCMCKWSDVAQKQFYETLPASVLTRFVTRNCFHANSI